MTRREFISVMRMAAIASLSGNPSSVSATYTRGRARYNPNDKRNRIGISSWSFHNLFRSTREGDESTVPPGMLALLDFPQMIADRYKVHNLEFVAPHFASKETAYIQELRLKLLAAHSHLINIPVDIEELWRGGGLSDTDERVRNAALTACKDWIDIARTLGARSIRCDPGRIRVNALAPTIDSYRILAAYGRSKGVAVIIENHGGVGSEHPEELIGIFRQVAGDLIGALPDFGNFPDEDTRMRGLELLFPYARTICHAKGLEFDANGNETKFDFGRCVQISKQAKFKGIYSIEYEGTDDPYAGVERVMNELLRCL